MKSKRQISGFTLLEMLVSVSIFLTIAVTLLAGMAQWQKTYRNIEMRNALQGRMRAALELMAQDVGQAGLVASGADEKELAQPLTTLSAQINPGNQTVTVGSTAGICDGEWLQFGAGSTWEKVQVTTSSGGRISGTFAYTHPVNEAVYARGVYPEGIIYPNAATFSSLTILGDINSKGNEMKFVKYSCPTGTSTAFTRQTFDLSGTAEAPAQVLIDNVTDCEFDYSKGAGNVNVTLPTDDNIWVDMITRISVTVTAKSETKDPFGSDVVVKEQYLNLQPRNVVASYIQSGSATPNTSELQILPGTWNEQVTGKNFNGNCTVVP